MQIFSMEYRKLYLTCLCFHLAQIGLKILFFWMQHLLIVVDDASLVSYVPFLLQPTLASFHYLVLEIVGIPGLKCKSQRLAMTVNDMIFAFDFHDIS